MKQKKEYFNGKLKVSKKIDNVLRLIIKSLILLILIKAVTYYVNDYVITGNTFEDGVNILVYLMIIVFTGYKLLTKNKGNYKV